MKQKVKQRLSVILGMILAVSLVLTGCGKSGGSSSNDSSGANEGSAETGKQVTVKYYNWDNEAQSVGTDAMLQEFMDQNPDIKVEHVVLVPGDSVEMMKKLDFLISSGEAIDVVQIPSLGSVLERATRGALAPLNEFYEKENIVPEDEYFVNPKIENNYYGMQYTKSFNYVMLNKDALDEVGLEVPKFGWTWDDYREYAKKLNKGEGIDKRYGTYFHTWELYSNAPAQTMMKDPFLYDDGTTILSDPTYKYFYQLRKGMESEDKSAKPFSDVLAAKLNYRTEFFNEEAAMILTGNWTIADPGNTEQYPHDFKTAFAPVPVPPKGSEPKDYEGKYFTSGGQLVMGANSENKEASFKLMRFMTTADSDNRPEFSGYKKANNEALLTKLVAGNEDMYDMDSLKYTLFDDAIQYLDAAQVMTTASSELTKVIEDGFSRYMLNNESIDDVQKWMVDEATKVINKKGVIK
ncbi:ABC transporter substrate-binding protein [Paenibacillus sp. N3/727]|uniref:ABC transporter substrate-binding protein n=1 Tax=Paenibacillus sp. N3/727 TaxID=2925845 RepID=UPI001F530CD8|nr:extracellular solute-binding protein [Paenibacillus sp. N3/727]UNK19170.1 ABC transporter substrate-binding protein [Paenibacillus sp. N3/727]